MFPSTYGKMKGRICQIGVFYMYKIRRRFDLSNIIKIDFTNDLALISNYDAMFWAI